MQRTAGENPAIKNIGVQVFSKTKHSEGTKPSFDLLLLFWWVQF